MKSLLDAVRVDVGQRQLRTVIHHSGLVANVCLWQSVGAATRRVSKSHQYRWAIPRRSHGRRLSLDLQEELHLRPRSMIVRRRLSSGTLRCCEDQHPGRIMQSVTWATIEPGSFVELRGRLWLVDNIKGDTLSLSGRFTLDCMFPESPFENCSLMGKPS